MYMNCTPCRSLYFSCSSGLRNERVCKYSCSAWNSAYMTSQCLKQQDTLANTSSPKALDRKPRNMLAKDS